MKKILSLLLCCALLTVSLVGCGEEEEEDKGAAIPVYLTTELMNFDPAYVYTDDASIEVLGLIFEGLTKIDTNGKVKPCIARSWTYTENPDEDYYMMEFTLNETAWSDGRQVSADDFVYAWKRIMEPEFQSEAAAMLYGIKNARDVKRGDMSIDDLGIYAVDMTVLQVEFDAPIDTQIFLEYVASPALVPLREDVVNKAEDWATNVSILVTNGPFTIRSFAAKQLIVERNIYYYRDVEDDSIKKYVTPYRLIADYSTDIATQLEAFENGNILYISEFPLAQRNAYKDQVEIRDTLNTHTYFFNTTKAPFDNANVRKALSLAIDRQAIVDLVVFAKPASGYVADKVFDSDRKTTFRSVGGELISASANMSEAQSLINSAGVSQKSFTLTIRGNEVDRAVAEYCQGVWSQLGFTVEIRELGVEKYEYNEYELYNDLFQDAYETRDFDVIAIDWQTLSTDAWSTLAPFAKQFAGGAMDLTTTDFSDVPHLTGYDSEAYNALIEEVFALKTKAEKAAKLHEAEQAIVNDMPVMPLFIYQDAYLVSSELSKVNDTFFGYAQFQKTNFRDYLNFATVAVTVADDAAVTAPGEE